MNNYFKTLELHKILDMLAKEASNDKTRKMISLLEPNNNINTVKTELNKTQTAYDLSIRFGMPTFINIKDITSSLNRAVSGAKLTLRELLDISNVLYQLRAINNWYIENEINDTPLDYLFTSLFPNKNLELRITNSIIDENTIADEASSELASIRRRIIISQQKVRDTLDKIVKSTSVQKSLQDNIITMRDGRYVIPVKAEYKSQISGLVHDTSATGATYFIEPIAVVEINNEIRVLEGMEHDEIERIISELSSLCAENSEKILSGYLSCAELNLYFAKASLAFKMNACCPEVVEDGKIDLKKARHPLIDKDKVVPVDIKLGFDYDALIITGPNTGGKTVILKTIGLLSAMTMCGLLIPVTDGSIISIFSDILVDIGDEQSIEQNLSTFSSHMTRVVNIINTASDKSLVLLDELGSGTDPVEGAALAISIIRELLRKGVKLVTTTHYQELKMFALETDNVENASCEFDLKTLQPTYRLIIGSPGKSNAFAISRKLGLDKNIVDYAKTLINDETKHFEQVISKLEYERAQLEKNNNEIIKNKQEIERIKSELTKEKEQFDKIRNDELEKARIQASRLVDETRRTADKIIDDIDEIRKQKDKENFSQIAIQAKSDLKGRMNKLYLDANPITQNSSYKLPRKLKKGDSVAFLDTKKKGTVLSDPDSKGNVFVQSGIMKTKVNSSELMLVESEKITYNSKKINQGHVSTKGVESRATRSAKMELDIRGYACDEGIMEVDSYLDNAIMAGLGIVTIIHGKGTGVLKNAIREHLKNHPLVKSYRKGLYGEGEDGVTVVELK